MSRAQGFLYYLPGVRRGELSDQRLRDAGLARLESPGHVPAEVLRGPDGGPGLLVADPQHVDPGQLKFLEDRQSWRRLPGAPAAWVGCYRGELAPTPERLLRPGALAGHAVELGGHRWQIPVARACREEQGDLRWYCALPQRSELDEQGHWRSGAVEPRYAALWQIATRWWDSRLEAEVADSPEGAGATEVAFDFEGAHDAACQVLATNYAVGPAEVALLGLLNTGNVFRILEAVVDGPTIVDWQKKKLAEAAGSSSPAGPADSTPATAPP